MNSTCPHTSENNPLNAAARAPNAPPRKGRPSEALGSFDLRDHIDVAARLLSSKPKNIDRDQWLRQEWAARNPAASLEGETYFIRKLHGKRDLVSRDLKQLHGILGLYNIGLMECCAWLDFDEGSAARRVKYSAAEFDAIIREKLKDHQNPFDIFVRHTRLEIFVEYERSGLENLAMVDGHETTRQPATNPHTRPRKIRAGEAYRLLTAPLTAGHMLILHNREGKDVVQVANEAFGLERGETLEPGEMFESPVVNAPPDPGLRQVVIVNWPSGLDPAHHSLTDLFDASQSTFDLQVLSRIAGAVLQTHQAPDPERVHVRFLPMDVVTAA
ncbi:hypothetical protein [Tropicimonas sp. S265A]|uniref:hypothetical protein n=1 Tax=Tropicimonas sp. S265A TaxID=3415134 RepID=UPI003C799475